MGLLIALILSIFGSAILLYLQHHKDPVLMEAEEQSVLFNAINTEDDSYYPEEKIFDSLNEAGIKPNFLNSSK